MVYRFKHIDRVAELAWHRPNYPKTMIMFKTTPRKSGPYTYYCSSITQHPALLVMRQL